MRTAARSTGVLPTPRAIKAAIDPFTFYQREIEGAPPLRVNAKGWSQLFLCPFHAETSGSFAVNAKTGAYHCHGCGKRGGSAIDFTMAYDRLDLDQARGELAKRYGVQCEPTTPRPKKSEAVPSEPKTAPAPLAPIPPEAIATRPTEKRPHGSPSVSWEYRTSDGRPLAFVHRFDPKGLGKVFAPQTWTPGTGWQWKAPPDPRPLYHLDHLTARPAADVLFCEGEKSADAGALLLTDLVTTTTMNGAQSPGKSDFGPTAGRHVRIWPDHDEPGAAYARKVVDLARAAGAVSFKVLDLSSLAVDPKTGEPRELPPKWDAADALVDGWTPEALATTARWIDPDEASDPALETKPHNDPNDPGPEPGASPNPAAAALSAAIDAIKNAIGRQADDPGAIFTPEAMDAWAIVQDRDRAEFARLRDQAGKAGARKGEIDQLVKAHSKRFGNFRTYFDENPSDPSVTGPESFRETSEKLPKPEGLLSYGALIKLNDSGNPVRLIDSLAAGVVAGTLRNSLAWDADAGAWQLWQGTHWEPLAVSTKGDALIADVIHAGTHPYGFKVSYLNGITQIIQLRGLLKPRDRPQGAVPFLNGLLDLSTRELVSATPDRALDWCLPHRYDPAADCPTIKAWLLRSVEGDAETVELLRAWLAALLRGITLQKFLMLLGRGGSGKGTFQRLALALVGAHNAAISALRDLEENRFEPAKLYGKRLLMINEAGRHGGALNMLKAATGGDYLPLERKHVQQSGSFVFGGLVLMATNEDLQSSDHTSGLERRRITIRFPVSATPEEVSDWVNRGGEVHVLHAEIPGLINWLLDLAPAEIRARIAAPPARVEADNLLGMAAGNSVADWMLSETVPDPDAWTQVGTRKERPGRSTGQTVFEFADEWLYANYLEWCAESGRSRPVALRKFRDTVADMAETLGCKVTHGRHPVTRAYSVRGLRLARKDDPADSEGFRKAVGRIPTADRKDRKDSGSNFVQKIPEQRTVDNAEVF